MTRKWMLESYMLSNKEMLKSIGIVPAKVEFAF